ncbi:arginine--tRNA ligase [Patescibacteria group bacterium]|nr:arginine--tRNA ligase [Patescibacteria group bacterium]
MLDIYVKFNKEIKNSPELQDIAKSEFKKLEDGDRENRKIWRIIRGKSLKEFDKIYKILDIKFDLVLGESFYGKYLIEEIRNALKKGIAVRNSDRSVIINLEKFNLPPCLIQKSDGATLYGTRDLATIRYRVKKYDPDKIIYVVGNEQALHFEQLFHSAELLDYISYDKLYHMKFGLVLGENRKKLSTREGRFINADHLINKVVELANKTIKEKNPSLPKKIREEASKVIGIGALKYNDLSQNRQTNIVFDWNKMMNFKGNSAPYLLYTYVRLKSILRKAKFSGKFKPEFLEGEIELNIIKKLTNFPDIVKDSADSFQINNLTDYLYLLASFVNNFYEKLPVLKAEKEIKLVRLALIKAVTIVFKNGLNLLGIKTLEKM